MMKHPSPIEEILNKCKHFNGIQHDACRANILYSTFRKPGGALVPLPCLRDENSLDICRSVEWYTQEEAEVIEARHSKAIEEFLQSIEDGKCLICKIQVEHKQVGRCVYGSCGHRLYQGKASSLNQHGGKR